MCSMTVCVQSQHVQVVSARIVAQVSVPLVGITGHMLYMTSGGLITHAEAATIYISTKQVILQIHRSAPMRSL